MVSYLFWGVVFIPVCIGGGYAQGEIEVTRIRLKGRRIMFDVENKDTLPLIIPHALIAPRRGGRVEARAFWFRRDTLVVQIEGEGSISVGCISDTFEIRKMIIIDGYITVTKYLMLLPGRRNTFYVRDWREKREDIQVVKVMLTKKVVAWGRRK